MNETIYLSRSFVEFGPFTTAEMHDFYKRGILQDTDYVSIPGGGWTHVNDWVASLKTPVVSVPPAKPVAEAKKAAAPAAEAKAKAPEAAAAPAPAPAKKAAVKKAKK